MNEEQLLDLYGFTCLHACETSGLWLKKDIQVSICYTRKHVSVFKINGVVSVKTGKFYSDPSELLSLLIQYI